MRKIYPLRPEGKNLDRVLEAVKHDIRKYMKRERRRDLPEGAQFWDFDCRFGATQDAAQATQPTQLIGLLDALAQAGGEQCYVELLARPSVWQRRPADAEASSGQDAGAAAAHPAQSDDVPDADLTDPDHNQP
jgi:hypothetical protein